MSNPARGILFGLLLGVGMWAGIILIAAKVWHKL